MRQIRQATFICCLFLLSPSPALGANHTFVHLSDESKLSGSVTDKGAKLAITLTSGENIAVWKRQVTRLENAPPTLTAEFPIRRYLEEKDASRREEILQEIQGISGLTSELLMEAASRPDHRLPAKIGRSRIQIKIRGSVQSADCVVVVPEEYDPGRSWPLWISMHGTGGSGTGIASIMEAYAHEHGFLLACPTEHQDRHGKGWGYSDIERSLTVSTIEEMKARFHVDPDRIYLNGWSRGGHASYDVAEHFPGIIAAINPIIGAPRAHYFGLLRNLTNIPCYVMNGALDQDKLVFAAREGKKKLETSVKAQVIYYEDPKRGHEFLLDHLGTAIEQVLQWRRTPLVTRSLLASVADSPMEGLWVRIDEIKKDSYRPGATLKMRNLRRLMNDEEKKMSAVHKSIYDKTAFVEARIENSRIILKSAGVRKITLFLNDELISLDKSFRVTARGKTLYRGKLKRDPEYLLTGLSQRRDRHRIFWNEVTVTLP